MSVNFKRWGIPRRTYQRNALRMMTIREYEVEFGASSDLAGTVQALLHRVGLVASQRAATIQKEAELARELWERQQMFENDPLAKSIAARAEDAKLLAAKQKEEARQAFIDQMRVNDVVKRAVAFELADLEVWQTLHWPEGDVTHVKNLDDYLKLPEAPEGLSARVAASRARNAQRLAEFREARSRREQAR